MFKGHRLLLLLLLYMAAVHADATAQSRTPYQCALQAARALEGSFPTFIQLVHPVKGLSYHEAGLDINSEKPFTRAQLSASMKRNARGYPITSAYDDGIVDSLVNIRDYLQDVAGQHHFSRTKDIRRNITFLEHSTDIIKPAGPGQTLISFHLSSSKPDEELMWSCLIVRTEMYGGKAYVVGLDYMYWTP